MPDKSKNALFNAVKSYADSEPARFHMPGHKGALCEYDVTEITGTDNLACPRGAILELENACAEAFGASSSLISVNGSTACNIAMLLAIGPERQILLGRGCHKSAISGAALAGHSTVPLFPDEYGVITPEAVAEALDKTPCGAVFITSPTYRGFACDIEGIAREAHRRDALLLVDAAHGAHFGMSPLLPPAPKDADLWCVSCHKTLNAMNQAAVLNVGRTGYFDKEAVRTCLGLVQTSSPSYPIMLSVEHSLNERGDWDAHARKMLGLAARIGQLPGISLMPSGTAYRTDPTRLNIRTAGLTGYELGAELEARGIYPEMSDMDCVTLITTPSDRPEWHERLYEALAAVSPRTDKGPGADASSSPRGLADYAGSPVFSVRDSVLCLKRMRELEKAAGCVAACAVGVYPPGTAVLFPGERITRGAVELLLRERDAGAELFGVTDGKIPIVFYKE